MVICVAKELKFVVSTTTSFYVAKFLSTEVDKKYLKHFSSEVEADHGQRPLYYASYAQYWPISF